MLERNGEICANGVPYCLCSIANMKSDGLTLDFSSMKGLGEMNSINTRGVLSKSYSEVDVPEVPNTSLYDEQSSDAESSVKDDVEDDFEESPVCAPSTPHMTLSSCEVPKFQEEIMIEPVAHQEAPEMACSLCFDNNKTKSVYLKIQCHGDCRFSCHMECFVIAVRKQGILKKKDYKDAICPTDGCGSHVHSIYKLGSDQTEELYYEDPIARVKQSEPAARKEKKKKDHQKKGLIIKAGKKDTSFGGNERCEGPDPMHDEVSEFAEVPSSSKHRPAPLNMFKPVIHLEKKTNEIEEKYAVSSPTTTTKKTAKKQKKNDTIDITDVLMKSKRDDIHKNKCISDTSKINVNAEKPKRLVDNVEAGDVLWEDCGHVLLSPRIDSSPRNVLDQIVDKLEPFLPELVLNTAKWDPHHYFPSDDLKDAILTVGVSILSDEDVSEINNLFLGGFLQIEQFVGKLKYFTCKKKSFSSEIGKNDLGKQLEEQGDIHNISETFSSIQFAIEKPGDCLICLDTGPLNDSPNSMRCPDCKEPYHSKITDKTMESNCIHGFTLCVCSSPAERSIMEDVIDSDTNGEATEKEEERQCVTEALGCGAEDVTSPQLSPRTVEPQTYEAPNFPIGCPLCLNNIQPTAVTYMKITCFGCCSYSCHRACYFDAMHKQGFNRKKDFKDAFCPTDGCGNPVLTVHEIDLELNVKLYYKDSKSKSGKSELAVAPKDKRRDSGLCSKKVQLPKRKEHMLDEVNKEAASCSVVSFSDAAEPQCSVSELSLMSRTAPLPLNASGNVIPLEKKINEVEEKYTVSSAPYKKILKKQRKVSSVDITDVGARKADQHFASQHHTHEHGVATTRRNRNRNTTIRKKPDVTMNLRQVDNWEELDDDFQWDSASHFSNVINGIVMKLESCLPDLVFNTVSFMKSEYFSSEDLLDVILHIGCNMFSSEEKSAVRTIFYGGFLELQKFVAKLKYFECTHYNFAVKIRKNDLGRVIESEGIPSFPSNGANSFDGIHRNANSHDIFIPSLLQRPFATCLNSEPGKREKMEERCKLQPTIAEEHHVSKMIDLKFQKLNLLVDVRRHEKSSDSLGYDQVTSSLSVGKPYGNNSSPREFCPSRNNIGFGGDVLDRSSDYSSYGARESASRISWNSSFDNGNPASNAVPLDVHQIALDNVSRLEFELRKADLDRKAIERENHKLRQEVEVMKSKLQDIEKNCKEHHTDLSILAAEAELLEKIEEIVSGSDKTRLYTLMVECEKRLTYITSSVAHSDIVLKSFTDLNFDLPAVMLAELTANAEKWREFESLHLNSLALIKDGHIVILPDLDDAPVLPASTYEAYADWFHNSTFPYIRLASELTDSFKTTLSSRACLTKVEFPTDDVIHSFIIRCLRMNTHSQPDLDVIVNEYILHTGCILKYISEVASCSSDDHHSIWKNIKDRDTKRVVNLSDNECMICYDSLLDETMDTLNCPSCKEPFHFKCVTKWLRQAPACPKCRLHWPDPNDFPSL